MAAHPLDGRRVLVTGGTGFLGRHLVRTLAETAEVEIRLIARSGTVDDLPAPARARTELVISDLCAPEGLDGVCAGVDAVIHLASTKPAAVGVRAAPDEIRRLNVEAAVTLAVRAAEAGVRRFVFVSSASVSEPVIAPPTPDIVAKRLAEEALVELSSQTRLELVILRPCLVAGEGQRGGPLLTMFRLCRRGLFPVFGAGLDHERPLVDVEDVAHGLILAATQGRPGGIYPLTSGVRYTLADLLAVAGALVGSRRPYLRLPAAAGRAWLAAATSLGSLRTRGAPLSDAMAELLLGDRGIHIEHSRRELGYRPHYRELRAMLARTYAWYGMSGQL